MSTHTQPTPLPCPQKWNNYPLEVSRTCKSKRALAAYQARMARDGKDIFVSEIEPRFVDIWERRQDADDFQPMERVSSLERLDKFTGDGSSDPSCRFIFLYTESSRGKLCCTLGQLNRVLAHHEVMPSFLDFCFEFKNKENPTVSTMFRFEDQLSPHSKDAPLRMQHAFNIVAPEKDNRHDNEHPWHIRHTTAYHSFNFTEARSTWITVKANRVIRERIISTGESLGFKGTDMHQQAKAQFTYSLFTHIQILEWCTEGWGGYIAYLEERVRKHATAIKLAPVEALSRKAPRRKSRPPLAPGPAATGFSHYSSNEPQPSGIGGRIRSNLSRMASGFSGHSRITTVTEPHHPLGVPLGEEAAEGEDEEQLDGIFRFDDLQRIRQVTDDAEQAGMIIRENLRILGTIRERYRDLFSSLQKGHLGSACNIDTLPYEDLLIDFCRQLSVLQGDLESYDSRVQVLLRSLERNEEMFQGILQYGNMRVGEYYARSAETSAETMEKWTVRMHQIAAETEQQTVSMHAITVLTLIFLPGTFVSVRILISPLPSSFHLVCCSTPTLFSSGIWDFNASKSHNMGDWETRIPALKLFLAISLPLMAVALLCWWITYRWAKGKHRIPSDWIFDALKPSNAFKSVAPAGREPAL
ncbi:hypothetical protein V8F20_011732 [Naviculisporaceae sp. PSN 640]